MTLQIQLHLILRGLLVLAGKQVVGVGAVKLRHPLLPVVVKGLVIAVRKVKSRKPHIPPGYT